MANQRNISNGLLLSILAHVILFCIVLFTFDSKYGTSDDLEMEMILSGRNILLEPSYFLRYTHIFIGYIIYQLYQWSNHVPWYGIYLLSSALVGLCAIMYAAIRISKYTGSVFFHVIVLWSHALFFLVNPQFTSSALLIHFGAISVLYAGLTTNALKKSDLIVYLLLSLWGAMMRVETYYLSLILSLPLLLSYSGLRFNRLIQIGLIVGLVLMSVIGLNKWHYQIQNKDQAWKNFNTYNELLAGQQILDYKHPAYQWSESTADDFFYRVGWTYEDYMLYSQWFMADTSIYNTKAFKALDYSFSDCGFEASYIWDKIYDLYIRLEFNDYVYGCILILLMAIIISPLPKRNKWFLISSIPLMGLLISYLFVTKHLPERVLLPIGFYALVISSLIISSFKDTLPNKKITIAIIVLLVGLSLPSIKQSVYQQQHITEQRNESNIWLDSLTKIDSSMVLMGIPSFISHPHVNPFSWEVDSLMSPFLLLDVGHHANSPNHFKMLDQMGIDDMHHFLLQNEHAFFIHRSNNTIMPWYLNYLYRQKGVFCRIEQVWQLSSMNITLYKIKANPTEK